MSDTGKIIHKRSLDYGKPYDRPCQSILSRFRERIRNVLTPITPSFLLSSDPSSTSYVRPAVSLESSMALPYKSPVSPQIEVEVDGYMATFDSSIMNDDILTHNGEVAALRQDVTNNYVGDRSVNQTAGRVEDRLSTASSHSVNSCLTAGYHSTDSSLKNCDEIHSAAKKRIRLDPGTPVSRGTPYTSSLFQQTRVDESGGQRSLDNERFLWSSKSATDTTASPQSHTAIGLKPAFSIAAFRLSNDKIRDQLSLLSNSYQESSFYRGRTTYGGASAHKRPNTGSSYQMVSSVKQMVKVKPVGIVDGASGVTSSTAKRILDVLEHTESLLNQSKVKSLNLNATDSISSFPLTFYKNQSLQSQAATNQKNGPPVKPLLTPTHNLLIQSRTALARGQQQPNNKVPLSATPVSSTDVARSVSGGGKMKRDHSKHYSSSKVQQADQNELVYELPTNVMLPSLQMFSPLGGKQISHMTSLFTFSEPIAHDDHERMSESLSAAATGNFIFRLPLTISPVSSGSSVHQLYSNMQEFTSISQSLSVTSSASSVIGITSMPAVDAPKTCLSDFKFDTANAVKRNITEASVSIMQGTSVLNVLSKSDDTSCQHSSVPSARPLSEVFSISSDQWECKECFVKNKKCASVCVACSTVNPSCLLTIDKMNNKLPSLAELFHQPADEWSCADCFVNSKLSDSACVACGAPQPQSVTKSSMDENANSSGLAVGDDEAKTTSRFSFGEILSPSGTAVESTNAGGFKFGGSLSSAGTTVESTNAGGFKFGGTGTDISRLGTTVETTNAGVFKFSGSLPAPGTTVESASAGNFKFGGSLSTSGTTIETIGAGGFKFGGTGTDISHSGTTVVSTSAGGFKFGGTMVESSSAGGFKFGGTATAISCSETTVQSTNAGIFKFDNSLPQTWTRRVNAESEFTSVDSAKKTQLSSNVMQDNVTASLISKPVPNTVSNKDEHVKSLSGTAIVCSGFDESVSQSRVCQTTVSGLQSKCPAVFSTVVPDTTLTDTVSCQQAVSTSNELFTFGSAPVLPSHGSVAIVTQALVSDSSQASLFGPLTSGAGHIPMFAKAATAATQSLMQAPMFKPSTPAGIRTALIEPSTTVTGQAPVFGLSALVTRHAPVQVPNFGSSTLTSCQAPIFGPAASQVPVFGKSVTVTTEAPLFGSSSTVTSQVQVFGSAVTATGPSFFGVNNIAPSSQPLIFGSATVMSSQPNAGLFAFGAASGSSSASRGLGASSSSTSLFNFQSKTASTVTSAAVPLFDVIPPSVRVTTSSDKPQCFQNVATFSFGQPTPTSTISLSTVTDSSSSSVFRVQPSFAFSGSTNIPSTASHTSLAAFGTAANMPVQSVFGQPSLPVSSAFNSAVTAGLFHFGQTSFSQSSAAPFGSFTATTSMRSFSTSSAPAFGSGISGTQITVSSAQPNVFQFGSVTNVAPFALNPPSSSTTTATTGFSLGKRSADVDTEATDVNKRKSAGFGMFTGITNGNVSFGGTASVAPFSVPQTNSAMFPFDANTQRPSAPWSNQPSSSAGGFSSTPSFQFGQQSSQSANLFQFGGQGQPQPGSSSGTVNTGQRVIKKAARKLNRK